MANPDDPNTPKERHDLPDLGKWGLGQPIQVGSKSKLTYKDIGMFLLCEHCVKEKPAGMSPSEYTSIEAGIAKNGKLAIWCKRHKMVIGEFTLKHPPASMVCACGDPNCGGGSVGTDIEAEPEPAFEMGQVVSTAGLDAWMEKNGGKEQFLPYLFRHHHGDGGDLSNDDKLANFDAIMKGDARVFSSYNIPRLPGGKLWIITDADRRVTTLLLPEEY
jgi:hypothetical protein